jgi:hypothetical protein
MASYKTAIERIANIEAIFYKEHSNIFCDKKYAIFKKKIDEDVFISDIADKLFESIWLKNYYNLINSQEIANKLFEISSSLSVVIAKNILIDVIKKIDNHSESKKDIIFKLNQLCEQGLEKNILCLLRAQQKEYYIHMISHRAEETSSLFFLLSKTYS